MKIAAVTMVYNEALILPYYLHHYGFLDEIHVLYETDSTDDSLEILRQAPNVVIENCHIEGGIDDIEKIKLMNRAVQSVRANWVYVVDPDEFVFPPFESPRDFLARQTRDVVHSSMFQVYRHRTDKDLDPSLPPVPQRVHGDADVFSRENQANRASNSVYIKPNIVRPSESIRFLPGHHQIEGNPRASSENYIGAHWQMADPSIAVLRRMERKTRISERNRAHNMGWQHYNVTVDAIRNECERHMDDPVIDALRSFGKEQRQKNTPVPATVNTSRYGGSMYTFDPLEHPICLSSPRRGVPFMPWRQHIPFAMLLVDLLRPRTLVELGVHYGDSYSAFCQAVAELRLNTACYGVDSWKGDSHAGFYGPQVLADLTAHHDPLYGSFSNLVQSTFDEALQHFADGTIDILHIDGYHTYKAVRHDFETWLPKMSRRGVVLLHDINEKQKDFGVWKAWDEIRVRYPNFAFMHSHGLGIVAVGQEPPEELSWLFGASDERVAAIRDFFFYLGERLTGTTSSEVDPESAIVPLYELEVLRAARDELDAIRASTTWRLARKLHPLTSAALPLGSRRRGLAARILSPVRAWFADGSQHSVQEPPNRRSELARKYFRGVGLATGSIDPNLRIPPNVSVDFADLPNYEELSELDSSEPRSQAGSKNTKGRRARLADISDEAYDFVVCDNLPEKLPHPIEALETWLRVVKPGGIVYLAVPDGSILSNSMSNLQPDHLGFRVVDSAVNMAYGSKDQIYIVEKANYVSKITDMLRKNPQATSLNAEYTIDVVVPIYNAYEEFERCLYRLFQHQDIYRIILIDDCSTDKRIKELLDSLHEHQCERFEIVENERNLGYLKTANKGIRMVRDDVILLNSDTEVTDGWARKMMACAYSRDRIATVTPFTNNGTECSIPEFGQNNEIPEGFTIDSFAELVENTSVSRYPELVTAIGFCMYIRRAIVDEIGYFDEQNFGRGYGEENDFSLRAIRKGYKNVLCDNTFVFHKGAASFLHTRDDAIEKSSVILERIHPEFWPSLHMFHQLNPLKELQDNVKREMKLRS